MPLASVPRNALVLSDPANFRIVGSPSFGGVASRFPLFQDLLESIHTPASVDYFPRSGEQDILILMDTDSQQHDLVKHVLDAGFPLNATSLIHLFVGGSQLHGAKVSGYDDLDIYGCYIEPPERILGVLPLEHYVWSSGSATEKNTADDVDVTTYSLHRWGELIRKGNPAILHYLFAANALSSSDTWERFIGSHREQLISKRAAMQYLGFAASQRMRLTGERGMGRHGQRTDLIEQYGFDVKFAMHYVRLLGECRELLREHRVTLPRPEKDLLIAIRTGKYTQDQVFELGDDLTRECQQLLENSDLRDDVDVSLLSRRIADAYQSHWRLCAPTDDGL